MSPAGASGTPAHHRPREYSYTLQIVTAYYTDWIGAAQVCGTGMYKHAGPDSFRTPTCPYAPRLKGGLTSTFVRASCNPAITDIRMQVWNCVSGSSTVEIHNGP